MEKRVLIVDDDEKLRKLVSEYLEGYGFQVTAVPDGRSFMATVRAETPDIILLDVMLPHRDGLELLREIRGAAENIPVIMLTAKGEDADRIVGLELGADDYLPKPFNPRELLARIRAVIRRRPQELIGPEPDDAPAGNDMHRRLKAILSADVRGFSRLMSEDELITIHTLKNYKDLLSSSIASHGGRVVDSTGDNLLAEFDSAVVAVRCAVEIQRELKTRNAGLPDHRRMEFRIGINLGDVVVERDRIYGDGVNIAARIEQLADPGGICVSGTVYDQVENKIPLGFEFKGERQVKNIPRPVRVYRLRADSEE
jgi:DNA-binding response OmpR family regulator